jgi:5-methylcytosine-specific restriction endonuclease McrA
MNALAKKSPATRMNRNCLVLNASFEPITVLPAKRAMTLILAGKAEAVEIDGTRVVRAGTGKDRKIFDFPVVIRLTKFVKIPRKLRSRVSNILMFARDNYRCQNAACGRHKSELRQREYLTRDHLEPQSRFAVPDEANKWTNVSTLCSACNNRKANRNLKECGMTLLSVPTEPHFVHLSWAVRKLTPLQRKYIAMFFGEDVADALA